MVGLPSRDGHPIYAPMTREEVEEAMRDNPPGWCDSRDHPVFDGAFVQNAQATRPIDDETEAVAVAEQERR